HVTLMPLTPPEKKGDDDGVERASVRIDDTSLLRDRGGATLKLEAEAPNQIELRKTSAAGLGDVITFVAGLHALDNREAQNALDLFEKAPPTAETLRYEVQALLLLDRNAEAQSLLERAIALDPNDAGSHALLGDLLVAQQKNREAAAAYTRAI